jgi:hypothetical protein
MTEFACHSKECAPPPTGTGGSSSSGSDPIAGEFDIEWVEVRSDKEHPTNANLDNDESVWDNRVPRIPEPLLEWISETGGPYQRLKETEHDLRIWEAKGWVSSLRRGDSSTAERDLYRTMTQTQEARRALSLALHDPDGPTPQEAQWYSFVHQAYLERSAQLGTPKNLQYVDRDADSSASDPFAPNRHWKSQSEAPNAAGTGITSWYGVTDPPSDQPPKAGLVVSGRTSWGTRWRGWVSKDQVLGVFGDTPGELLVARDASIIDRLTGKAATTASGVIELACRSAECAPPPVGTGGSTKGSGSSADVMDDSAARSVVSDINERYMTLRGEPVQRLYAMNRWMRREVEEVVQDGQRRFEPTEQTYQRGVDRFRTDPDEAKRQATKEANGDPDPPVYWPLSRGVRSTISATLRSENPDPEIAKLIVETYDATQEVLAGRSMKLSRGGSSPEQARGDVGNPAYTYGGSGRTLAPGTSGVTSWVVGYNNASDWGSFVHTEVIPAERILMREGVIENELLVMRSPEIIERLRRGEYPASGPSSTTASVTATVELACYTKECAPPPTGTGGSSPAGTSSGSGSASGVTEEGLKGREKLHEAILPEDESEPDAWRKAVDIMSAGITEDSAQQFADVFTKASSDGAVRAALAGASLDADAGLRSETIGQLNSTLIERAGKQWNPNDYQPVLTASGMAGLKSPDLNNYTRFISHDSKSKTTHVYYLHNGLKNEDGTWEIPEELSEFGGPTDATGNASIGARRAVAAAIRGSWANSARSPLSNLASQEVASMGLASQNSWESLQGYLGTFGTDQMSALSTAMRPAVSQAVRAAYDATQADLKQRGITSVTLYRGASYDPIFAASPGTSVSIREASLTSWSTDPYIADQFAGYSNGRVLEMTVPASRIFSTAQTGLGSQLEWEAVVLGSDGDDATVYDRRQDNEWGSVKPVAASAATNEDAVFLDADPEQHDWIKVLGRTRGAGFLNAVTAACQSKECAPPPVGKGGSLPKGAAPLDVDMDYYATWKEYQRQTLMEMNSVRPDETFVKTLQGHVAEAPVAVRMRSESFQSMAYDDPDPRIRNLYEVDPDAKGDEYLSVREDYDGTIGLRDLNTVHGYSTYVGWVEREAGDGYAIDGQYADYYGEVELILSDSVKERSYFTVSDSLDSKAIPMPIRGEIPPEHVATQLIDDGGYTEVQIPGPIPLSEIAEIRTTDYSAEDVFDAETLQRLVDRGLSPKTPIVDADTFTKGDVTVEDFIRDQTRAQSQTASGVIELACRSKSCAPPPVGTGGSVPGELPGLMDWVSGVEAEGQIPAFDPESEVGRRIDELIATFEADRDGSVLQKVDGRWESADLDSLPAATTDPYNPDWGEAARSRWSLLTQTQESRKWLSRTVREGASGPDLVILQAIHENFRRRFLNPDSATVPINRIGDANDPTDDPFAPGAFWKRASPDPDAAGTGLTSWTWGRKEWVSGGGFDFRPYERGVEEEYTGGWSTAQFWTGDVPVSDVLGWFGDMAWEGEIIVGRPGLVQRLLKGEPSDKANAAVTASGLIELACHSKSCAPPPYGTGGSVSSGYAEAISEVRKRYAGREWEPNDRIGDRMDVELDDLFTEDTPPDDEEIWTTLTETQVARQMVSRALKMENPDPLAIMVMQEMHRRVASELPEHAQVMVWRSGRHDSDPFAPRSGPHGTVLRDEFDANTGTGVTSWWGPTPTDGLKPEDDWRIEDQIRNGQMAPGENFQHKFRREAERRPDQRVYEVWVGSDRILGRFGDMRHSGELLVAHTSETIDRLMSGTFPIVPTENRVSDWGTVGSANVIELACRSKECAPPPVGTGGSSPQTGAKPLDVKMDDYTRVVTSAGYTSFGDPVSDSDLTRVQEAVQQSPIAVRMDSASFDAMAEGTGDIRNLHEVGIHMKGQQYYSIRKAYDDAVGLTPMRAVYGYSMAEASIEGNRAINDGMAGVYGAIALVMDDSVKDRSYFTVNDSLNSHAIPLPIRGDAPAEHRATQKADPIGYAEVQIPGPIQMSEVTEIRVKAGSASVMLRADSLASLVESGLDLRTPITDESSTTTVEEFVKASDSETWRDTTNPGALARRMNGWGSDEG